MIYATSREGVEQARVGFLRKWKLRCKAVSVSFEEAGDELFTFTAFPSSQWKALRTTNALERINEEFRRRTKPRLRCPVKRLCCSCSSASCAAVKCGCAVWSAGRI
jgi:putative transposase